MERRQFTRKFKLEAVRLIKERGVSYAQDDTDSHCPCSVFLGGDGSIDVAAVAAVTSAISAPPTANSVWPKK
jgi:hypothetical protein